MNQDHYVDFQKQTKRCNGPLHQGQQVPVEAFSTHTGSYRPGKLYSRCRDCLNFQRWGEGNHGLVELSRVWFIFQELENRLGRAETIRRLDISENFFWRVDHEHYKHIRRGTVKKAMEVLTKCRADGEARHRKSIKHGAKQRGREERTPKDNHEFYNRYKAKDQGSERIYNNIEKVYEELTSKTS